MTHRLLFILCLLPAVVWGQVAQYPFQSYFDPYTPIVGGAVLGDTQNDDRVFNARPIGFTFNYNGASYTEFSVNTNGFIAMGPFVSSSGQNVAFGPGNVPSGYCLGSSTGTNEVIAGFNMDLQAQAGAELSYITQGAAPNRKLIVQWSLYRIYTRNPAFDSLSFQIHLYEGSNTIEVHYGRMIYGRATPYTAQVGLRGSSRNDFNARTGQASWFLSNPATQNTQGMLVADTLAPSTGLVYGWSRPTTGLNLATRRILVPAENGCVLGTFPLSVEVQNGAATPIDTVIGDFTINGIPTDPDTIVLPTTLFPGERTVVDFNNIYDFSPFRTYQVSATMRALREDAANQSDDSASASFTSAPVIRQLPFQELFNSTTQFPSNWRTQNLQGQGNWEMVGPNVPIGNRTGGGVVNVVTTAGSGAAFFNSFSSTLAGGKARLYGPCLDISRYTPDSLILEVSFLQSNADLTFRDSIQVEVSTDNGLTYTPIRTLFRPTTAIGNNQGRWNRTSISLNAYIGQANLRLGFVAGGANGFNLAIDYIRLREGTFVANKANLASLVEMYPNPTTGTCTLKGLPAAMLGAEAQILNGCGQVVSTFPMQAELHLQTLPAGLYTLKAKGLSLRFVRE